MTTQAVAMMHGNRSWTCRARFRSSDRNSQRRRCCVRCWLSRRLSCLPRSASQAISHWATLKLGEDLCERKAQVFDRTRVEMTLEMERGLDQDEQARKHRLRQRRAEADERARDAAAEEKLLDMVDDADEPPHQGNALAIANRPRGRGDLERGADGERKQAPLSRRGATSR